MSDTNALEALQILHRDLVAVCEHRFESLQLLEQSLEAHTKEFEKLLARPARRKESRDAVQSGKVTVYDEDYSINRDFQENVLQLADELDLDEIEATKLLLDAEGDQLLLGRPLLECGIIRFHQQRKYLLDCIRLCIQLTNDDELESDLQDVLGSYVDRHIYCAGAPGEQPVKANKIIPKAMSAMQEIKMWLQKLSDRVASASVLYSGNLAPRPEFQETIEFSRLSLLQQHESLAVILCSAIEKRQAGPEEFRDFFKLLRKCDRYDHLTVHFFPVLGAYISVYGLAEGTGDVTQARELNEVVCKNSDDDPWLLSFLGAAARAWWIAEYSGHYLDDLAGVSLVGVDLDKEDEERSKMFLETLKDGAFDFMLSVAADVSTPEWQDPTRQGMRQWLQRKSPSLATDFAPFSDFFQTCLTTQLEVFVDAFISNMPDVLRQMRVEEDEQRQLSQAHEQDLDLERFLIIISYAYEGRPEAAEAFWSDPDSNLAGFMHWASRRASTPLVSAFCEMLQAISGDEDCATAAHVFLLDEGHHSSGKMRRTLSLTWTQIFKELLFFSNKIRERPTPPQSHLYRGGKPSSEQAETEPESAMMLECYLRLVTRLSSQSGVARHFLLANPDFNLVEILYQLASSMIPARLRACAFWALRALVTNKTREEGSIMWSCLDSWMTGAYAVPPNAAHRVPSAASQQNPIVLMEAIFEEIGNGFEEPNAFIRFLISLITPTEEDAQLNDSLPFPENLGSAVRVPGIELYVDFVLGHVFGQKHKELGEMAQLRILRLGCLEFALVCLNTFNEDLIVLANETSIPVDAAISATDLATYVRLHPFARVMEWMFNDKVVDALFSTIHQDTAEVGRAAPDSPLILGILRGVELISKVLDLQDTYLDLVRPLVRLQGSQRRQPVANAAYVSFDDGIMSHLDLVVDLGRFCGIGHPDLTLACLKLLERISTSSKVISAWAPGPGRQTHRNTAIVALEANGENEAISGSFAAELVTPLDVVRRDESPNYMIKIFILDFLYACLRANPDQPNIAHLLLGFTCGLNTLSVEPNGSFDSQSSLFHNLVRVVLEAPFADADLGMRQWLVTLKFKTMRVLQILWSSSLSSQLVLDELRQNDFLFHLLLREVPLSPNLPWDGQVVGGPEFLLTDASTTFIYFLSMRAMTFEYVSMELCSVSQNRLPHLKRRIFDALNGQIVGEADERMEIPTIFDLYDFLPPPDGNWDMPPMPRFTYYKDIDLKACVQGNPDSNTTTYNVDKVREILLLKRNEAKTAGVVVPTQEVAAMDREEALLIEYLVYSNRLLQLASHRLKALRAWTNLLLVMFESNEFKGVARVSFLLQTLQSILPSLEGYAPEGLEEASELARLARVLLFKLDLTSSVASDKETHSVGNLISDKLFQLFQICLQAIGKRAGPAELRAVYYGISYRYLTGIVDNSQGFLLGRQKTIRAIQVYGERLLGNICDDACGGDPSCQAAAFLLLGAFVNLGRAEEDAQIVDVLNRLNFVGVLVDSLKTIMAEWLEIIQTGGSNIEQEQYQNAKLALLLQLCQTREGAKYVLQANLFRSLHLSGLFSADPELQIDPSNAKALEKHYSLLVSVTRIIGAAVLSRGSHNALQGRRFLTEHRMLIMHVLKRSAGIGGNADEKLEERIDELAEALMILITATGFLESEEGAPVERKKTQMLFH